MILARIRILCTKRGTTVKALERTLDFGNGTISKWDTVSPSVDNLNKVAQYFNVPIDYFVKEAKP